MHHISSLNTAYALTTTPVQQHSQPAAPNAAETDAAQADLGQTGKGALVDVMA
jgi:hypothetical protein